MWRTALFILMGATSCTLSMAQSDPESASARLRACTERGADPRFDSIRAVFPLDGAVNDAMLTNTRTPTKVQAEALRLWLTYVSKCSWDVVVPSGAPTPRQQRARDSQLIKVNLLASSKITFAEYATLQKANAESDEFWIAQLLEARQKALAEPRPVAGLACTFDAGAGRGLETFVQFDESQQKVWANRGGAISRSWIDQSTIGYQQDKSTFMISRITGNITWTGDGVGVMGTGQCIKATTQKF